MTTTAKILVAVAAFVLALGGALLLMHASSSKGGDGAGNKPLTSDIWSVGDTWTVKVRQDGGAISPDGDTNIALIPFRFKVESAPKGSKGTWKVHVTQDGAQGPFAKGWNLWYRNKGGAMVLHRVAVGAEKPLEAELAVIVLGAQFPYEVTYDTPPVNKTIDAKKLLDRSQLPPSTLPSGAAPSAAPPPAP